MDAGRRRGPVRDLRFGGTPWDSFMQCEVLILMHACPVWKANPSLELVNIR